MYTGNLTKPWSEFNLYSANTTQNPIVKIHSDFKGLLKLFQLDESELLKASISSENKLSFENLDDFCADVIVKLADGKIRSHSLFLSTRCPFFGAITGKANYWNTEIDNCGLPCVNLTHISKSVFKVILRWITLDSPRDLFDGISYRNVAEWLQFIQEVLIASNELLIPRIVSFCSWILSRFITINNVIAFLELSCIHEAPNLKNACLDFGKY